MGALKTTSVNLTEEQSQRARDVARSTYQALTPADRLELAAERRIAPSALQASLECQYALQEYGELRKEVQRAKERKDAGYDDRPPHPGPEVWQRPLADGDPVPRAVTSWTKKIGEAGWLYRVMYSRGHRLTTRGTAGLIHTVAIQMRYPDHRGYGAVACWRSPVRAKLDWTCDLAMAWRAGHFIRDIGVSELPEYLALPLNQEGKA